MFNSKWRDELSSLNSTIDSCPVGMSLFMREFHDPCFDITDQLAIVTSRMADVYFAYPRSEFDYLLPSPNDPVYQTHRCNFWDRASPESELNYRLRKAGALIHPFDFGFVLAPTRKEPLTCRNSIDGNLVSCLKSKARLVTSDHMRQLYRHRATSVNCTPGSKSSIPSDTNRYLKRELSCEPV